jgi:peroxiredoxin
MRTSLLFLLALLACGEKAGENLTGMWDATVVTAGVSVPFRLRLKQAGVKAQGTLFDGQIEYPSDSGKFEAGKLHLHWNITNADLDAGWDGSALTGSFVTSRSNSKLLTKTISAKRASTPKDEAKPASLGGDWTLKGDDNDPKNVWTITIRQNASEVSGAIQRLDGDSGTLTGRVRGNELVMSHFSGIRPGVLRAELGSDGLLHVTYNDSLKMTGFRSDIAQKQGVAPLNPRSYTKVTSPDQQFPFAFPDLTGRLVSGSDRRYRGKVVLINLTGSWCPNCNDDAPFLEELYKRYRTAGLEVVGLSFESGDLDYDRERVRQFIERNKVTYPILIAGTTDNVAEKLPFVENFAAFPTTFFLGRDGRVKIVHDGFSGASTGIANVKLKREIEEQVKELLRQQHSNALSGANLHNVHNLVTTRPDLH